MNNFWGAMITGAVIGAAATYYFLNHEDKLINTVSRIKAQSRDAFDSLTDMEEEMDDLL